MKRAPYTVKDGKGSNTLTLTLTLTRATYTVKVPIVDQYPQQVAAFSVWAEFTVLMLRERMHGEVIRM